jgi:ribosome-associated toxin RatA of RatAB toxin-antitoxin module
MLIHVSAGLSGADNVFLPQITMTELEDQDLYFIHGSFDVEVDPSQVWKILSDYENLQGIFSELRSSKVIERRLDSVLVEQVVDGKFLFVRRGIKIMLQIREKAPWRIEFSQMNNQPFRHYDGYWLIEPQSQSCRVGYNLTVSRGDMAPMFLERKLFRDGALNMLQELQAEVIRRAVANR